MVYTPLKESRIKDPDCIPNFPGFKDKLAILESPGEFVRNTNSLPKICYIRNSGVGSLNNFDVYSDLGTTIKSYRF